MRLLLLAVLAATTVVGVLAARFGDWRLYAEAAVVMLTVSVALARDERFADAADAPAEPLPLPTRNPTHWIGR